MTLVIFLQTENSFFLAIDLKYKYKGLSNFNFHHSEVCIVFVSSQNMFSNEEILNSEISCFLIIFGSECLKWDPRNCATQIKQALP